MKDLDPDVGAQEIDPASPDSPGSGAAAIELLTGDIDYRTVTRFRGRVFSSLGEVRRLRDWLASPAATGVRRGLALWALGRHQDAVAALEEHASNAAIASCMAQSYTAMGRLDEAEALLTRRQQDPSQATAWLGVLEARRDADRLQSELDRLGAVVGGADRKYYAGRAKELGRDVDGAIALYDQTLAIDEVHAAALFRLAVNVDLRGEDEEARELYERALLHPPVNLACVINLGILYEDMGNYRRAMQCFDLALQSCPDEPRARLFRLDAAAALDMYYDEEQELQESRIAKTLRTPLTEFELSVRSRNCLQKMDIRTLGDLVRKTESELLSFKNFGDTSLTEIKEILEKKSLRLGMTSDDLLHGDLDGPLEPQVAAGDLPDPESPDPSRRPVTHLELSVRSRRIVDLLNLKTIGDLAHKTEAELLACPNFGQTSLTEIRTKLNELGMGLRI